MNEITRQAYVKDCEIGLKRWNRLINKAGYDITLNLPSTSLEEILVCGQILIQILWKDNIKDDMKIILMIGCLQTVIKSLLIV